MKRCPKCNRTFDDKENFCPFDSTRLVESVNDNLLGTILDKRYKVIEKIGEGGMGKVYKAEHIVLSKPFAIKVINPELVQREDSLKRFINEAKVTSKIGHPNIIEITDFGKTPTGSFIFVMEYIRGKTLYDLLNQLKIIPPDVTAEILIQCADALYYVHQEGIIHRDLKPDNIMLIEKGRNNYFVKILDFGISKIAGDVNTRLTSSGIIIGTPEYMSPEQASQEKVDHRTDIYSLGVIMYQMLTGNLPFTSSNLLNLLMMHKTKSPKPLKFYNPDIPPAFEPICLKCLAKNPADRYQTMQELFDALKTAHIGQSNDTDIPVDINKFKGNEFELKTEDIPPIDIPPEKIAEVRNQLFADSHSVWFDPYSKPEDINTTVPQEENRPDSIIIDTTAAEKEGSIQLDDSKLTYPADEELRLVSEVPKPRSPVPKVNTPLKERRSAIKENKSINFENLFNKKNIAIGIGVLFIIVFILSSVIYRSVTSGIESDIKREIKFNTPLPVNPAAVNVPEKKEIETKTEIEDTTKTADRSETRVKAAKPKQEKIQTIRAGSAMGPHDYFREANNYFKSGKYDIAAEYYKSAIRLKPDFAMAYRGLGACYAMLGKAELSIRQYEKYIELDPNGPDVEQVIKIINEYKSKKK
ncbi:MAG: protein kinase domain-containing protein [Myxococcota bacterium]